jgi:hypothetical protein
MLSSWLARWACRGMLAGALFAGGALAQTASDATIDPVDPPDFSVLVEPTPEMPVSRPATRPASGAPAVTIGNRTEKLDGSVTGSAGRRLPTAWESKVGVDFGFAAPAPRPDTLLPGQAPQDRGTGWANVTVPALDAPIGWDKATIDARLDPDSDQAKLSTSLSRSVPIGGGMSVTLRNGYSMTRTLASPGGQAMPAASPGAAQVFTGDGALRLELPSATALSAGATMSSVDDRLLRSLSAEQKLFDTPLSITGAISERPTGDTDKSIKAGFRHTW